MTIGYVCNRCGKCFKYWSVPHSHVDWDKNFATSRWGNWIDKEVHPTVDRNNKQGCHGCTVSSINVFNRLAQVM